MSPRSGSHRRSSIRSTRSCSIFGVREKLTLLINEQSSHRILKHADRIYVLRAGRDQAEGCGRGAGGRRRHQRGLFRFSRASRRRPVRRSTMSEFLQNVIDASQSWQHIRAGRAGDRLAVRHSAPDQFRAGRLHYHRLLCADRTLDRRDRAHADRRLELAGPYSVDLPDRGRGRAADRRARLPPAAARLLADADDRVLRGQLHHSERRADDLRLAAEGGQSVVGAEHADSDRRAAPAASADRHASWLRWC